VSRYFSPQTETVTIRDQTFTVSEIKADGLIALESSEPQDSAITLLAYAVTGPDGLLLGFEEAKALPGFAIRVLLPVVRKLNIELFGQAADPEDEAPDVGNVQRPARKAG